MRNFIFIIRVILLLLFAIIQFNQGFAQQRDTTNSWLTLLPACPCEAPDLHGVKIGDGWAKDKGNINKYHKGAASSYRSYPAIKTSEGRSEQQCCYDKAGKLITSGQGAGTPDKSGACSGEDSKGYMKINLLGLWRHYWKDVRPWNRLMKRDSSGWRYYNSIWIPNNANHCPTQ